MTDLESMVDAEILNRILQWTQGLEDFDRQHAVDGLFNAYGLIVPPFDNDKEGLWLLSLNSAFWFWIDDRSDNHFIEKNVPFNWDNIIEFSERIKTSEQAQTRSCEEVFVLRMSRLMKERSSTREDYEWWCQTLAYSARGMRFEEQAQYGIEIPSYSTCIEYGRASVTLLNYLAATSLIFRLERTARHGDMVLIDLERCYCIYNRMLNDFYSVDKERYEGSNGKTTNIVLLMEEHLGKPKAMEFIKRELNSIECLIGSCAERLGRHDPFVRIILYSMSVFKEYYESHPERYKC